MRNLLFVPFLLGVASCGTNQSSDHKTTTADSSVAEKPAEPAPDLTIPPLPADYVKMNLSKIGLKATLMAPAKADCQQSTIDDNQGQRNEYIVWAFKVLSGDTAHDREWGGQPAEIDICTSAWGMEEHKQYIRSSIIDPLNKILQDDSSCIIYTTPPGNTSMQPLRAKDKNVYHFLMLTKGKDDKQYSIRSGSSTDLTREEMFQLLAIAKTIEL